MLDYGMRENRGLINWWTIKFLLSVCVCDVVDA